MRLTWWLSGIIVAGVAGIALSALGAADPVKNTSQHVASPIESGLRDVADLIAGLFDGMGESGLEAENERLRDEIEQLKGQLAAQQDLEHRLEEAEQIAGVKGDRPEDVLIVANVIAEDPSPLKRPIAIDRGIDDGVDEGMVVLSRNGSLVGTVSRAYADFAWVRLITDPDSTVNVQVNVANPDAPGGAPRVLTGETPAPTTEPDQQAQETTLAPTPTPAPQSQGTVASTTPVRAEAKGELGGSVLLELLPSSSGAQQGDLVVTSGLGGNYPPGIPVGAIEALQVRPQAPFVEATLEPAADLGGLDTVLILVSFKPARLEGP